MTRLHVACGHVYLYGYDNIDLPGEAAYLAADRPDLVEANGTDFSHYYKHDYAEALALAKTRLTVCDVYADMRQLPYAPESVEEIVCVQTLEHLLPQDADKALAHWHDLLQPGGTLFLTVPDMVEDCKRYLCAALKEDLPHEEYALYLIYGSRKNSNSHHYDGFSKARLKDKLIRAGFDADRLEWFRGFHAYPALVVRATK